MRRSSACLLGAVALALPTACGREPSETDRVRDAVEAFGTATAERDYQRICDELISRQLVSNVEQVGLPCESAFQRALREAREPRIDVKTIAVREGRALVGVRSTAANQRPSDDVLELVREGGRWKIAALAKPQPQPTPRP